MKIAVTASTTVAPNIYPIPCIANTPATRAPLFFEPENSLIIVELSGYPPPIPNPSRKRKKQRVPMTP